MVFQPVREKETVMRSRLVWALVVLNVVLLTCLVGQWVRPNAAVAQVAGAPRVSDYILIPGSIQGSPSQLIYIIDTQNGLLSARLFDGQIFQDMPPIQLNRVFGNSGPNQGRPRRGY
jgi:heme A synthase